MYSPLCRGAGFDGQLHDYFVDTLRQEIFDAAFGDPEMWKIADIIDGSGQYLDKAYVVNYFASHDESWPSSGGQRFVKSIDGTPLHDSIFAKGRLKPAAGVTLFAQGVPMIFYGDEWGEIEDFSGGGNGGSFRWVGLRPHPCRWGRSSVDGIEDQGTNRRRRPPRRRLGAACRLGAGWR